MGPCTARASSQAHPSFPHLLLLLLAPKPGAAELAAPGLLPAALWKEAEAEAEDAGDVEAEEGVVLAVRTVTRNPASSSLLSIRSRATSTPDGPRTRRALRSARSGRSACEAAKDV